MPLLQFLDWEAIKSECISNIVSSAVVDELIDADWCYLGDVLIVLLFAPELFRQEVTPQQHHLKECLLLATEDSLFFFVKCIPHVAVWVIHLSFVHLLV